VSGEEELPLLLRPYLEGRRNRSTIEVLVWVFRTGRQIEAWLSGTLAANGLDTSEFTALTGLWFAGEPHRLSAGEIAATIVQTSGGTTKTIRRLEQRGLIRRIEDPDDRRRTLIELTAAGRGLAEESLVLVIDAFDLEIGDLDDSERFELSRRMARLSQEFDARMRR